MLLLTARNTTIADACFWTLWAPFVDLFIFLSVKLVEPWTSLLLSEFFTVSVGFLSLFSFLSSSFQWKMVNCDSCQRCVSSASLGMSRGTLLVTHTVGLLPQGWDVIIWVELGGGKGSFQAEPNSSSLSSFKIGLPLQKWVKINKLASNLLQLLSKRDDLGKSRANYIYIFCYT